MGKRTKQEKEKIRLNTDILMNLPSDLAYRNPKLRALHQKYPKHFVDKVFDPSSFSINEKIDELFKEIYGERFPLFPFPAMRLEEYEKDPSELIFRVDLNFTKDEIMHCIEGDVSIAHEQYKKTHTAIFERKNPLKWQTYLEIWDLKNGDPPWIDFGDGLKAPRPAKREKRRPWTYEEIAKYLYPDSKAPEQLNKAVNKVKKQYRAAYELVCGKKYNANRNKKLINQLRENSSGGTITCDSCPDKPVCNTLCPPMLEDLTNLEVKQKHHIISTSEFTNLEMLKTRSKKLSSDDQFK